MGAVSLPRAAEEAGSLPRAAEGVEAGAVGLPRAAEEAGSLPRAAEEAGSLPRAAEEAGAGGSEKVRGAPGKGVPLTITPPLNERRPDAMETGTGRNGMEPKVTARIRRGAAGCLA